MAAHYAIVELKRRRLPHLHVIGQPLFVTFRLHGSLPANRPFPASNLSSGEAFPTMDRLLDQARSEPTFLREPAIAQLVLNSIEYGVGLGHYEMHSFVIMPNHVHLLLTPQVSVSKLSWIAQSRHRQTSQFAAAAERATFLAGGEL